jgi:long-chain fatty acid transport protein
MRKYPHVVLALVACAGVASVAQASPLLEAVGSLGGAGGQQGRHVAGGAASAYFNPALLMDAPTGLTFGVVGVASRIAVGVDARQGTRFDVPPNLENGAHADFSRWAGYPIGTKILENGRAESASESATSARPRQAAGSGDQTNSYEAVGLVAKLLRERLAFGFYGLIPNRNFTQLSSFYVDEREQYSSNSLHPELYGDRLNSLAIACALAYRITDGFSLGVGTTVSFLANAATPAYVADAAQLQNLVINMDAKVHVGLSPHGGFAWSPTSRLHLTGTLHSPQKLEVGAAIKFLLASGLEQESSLKFVYDWMPWQVGLGASYDVIQREAVTLTFATSGVYGRWSQYIDRHGERPVPVFGWRDTITAAAGMRARIRDLGLAFDLQYKPTPVPLQYGRSNYVDNDRVGANLGGDYAFSLMDTKMSVGVQLQAFHLLKRSTRKLTPPTFADGVNRTPALVTDEVPDDGQVGGEPIAGAAGLQTNNPGWPGFSSQGWIATFGLYLTVTL